MEVNYQLVTLGFEHPQGVKVIETLFDRVEDLGLGRESIDVLDETNYFELHKNNSPTVALYFGKKREDFPHLDVLDDLIHGAAYVLPVVEDLEGFGGRVPEKLRGINGFKLDSDEDVEPLVAAILEGFSLLRTSRRLFISYKRSESTGVAIQLYEALEKAGFDVFLDTHSVRPGDDFQEELWHRLADTDVVVLLNSPNIMASDWTKQELAQASGMSIAILQLVWPGSTPLPNSELTIPLSLTATDFTGSHTDSDARLNAPIADDIISKVESLRARALAARQDNLTTEFKRVAERRSVAVELQPQKFFSLDGTKGKKVIIPTIGVPQAFTYNQSDDRVRRYITSGAFDVYLLYDHKNIKERWLKHLSWLDNHLPIKSFKIVDAESWLINNI